MQKHCFLIALTLLCGLISVEARPQSPQIDSHTVYEQKRDWVKNPATIFDEIENPTEREDFRALTRSHDPAERLKLAEAFLAAYPQSWVLAQVYALASNGAMETGRYDRALEYGKDSLQILPEDPLLLVPIASLEARNGEFDQAERDCHEALDELDRLLPPAAVPAADWPTRKRELQATCYFNLARAKVTQGLGSTSAQQREELLRQSLDDLAHAREHNPQDAEIPYLAGLALLSLNEAKPAAEQFAAAYHLGGPIGPRALAQLKKLHTARESNVSLDQYIQALPEPALLQPAVAVKPSTEAMPNYAGSETCRECHAEIYGQWSHTGMAKMFRPYRPENVIGDFTHRNVYYEEPATPGGGGPNVHPKPFARMIIDHGRHYFEINQTSGWRRYPVDYTIGSKWEQAYATRLPNGEIHVFPVQYNLVQKKWLNFWKTLDAPGSKRTDLRQWENLDIYTNYQANCAVCHTSQLRNTNKGGIAATGVEFREPGIDCEMCHGPAARHVAAMESGHPYEKRPIDPPVDFNRISAREFVAICAQCHEQSAVRQAESDGELNYSRGGDFYQHYKQRPLGEFTRKAFYKDGRFRGTAFIVESLMRSECFQEGNVTCGSCHDPHASDAASNPTSLRFRDHPDEMCTQCHVKFKTDEAVQAHTHHPVTSAGSRCTSCHMPRIMDALLFEAASHQISEIPNAEMTQRFGQDESPNACILCHKNKNAGWVSSQIASWANKEPETHPRAAGGD